MRYKGAHKPLPQIAKELNVDAVVEGTVLRSGNHVRITAQFIQARVDKQLWADTYQGDVRDVLALQNQVASAIARQIRVKLSPSSKPRWRTRGLSTQRPTRLSAGRQPDADRGRVSPEDCVFERALAGQPDYVEAHVGLADAYMFLGHMVALPPQEAFPRAKSEALKALQLDDSQAEAHVLLGTVKFLYDWDFPGAEKEFQRALFSIQILWMLTAIIPTFLARWGGRMKRSSKKYVSVRLIRSPVSGSGHPTVLGGTVRPGHRKRSQCP